MQKDDYTFEKQKQLMMSSEFQHGHVQMLNVVCLLLSNQIKKGAHYVEEAQVF